MRPAGKAFMANKGTALLAGPEGELSAADAVLELKVPEEEAEDLMEVEPELPAVLEILPPPLFDRCHIY